MRLLSFHPIAAVRASVVPPLGSGQLGISSSTRSRGMDTTSTLLRSAEMCTSRVVSERMPATSPPPMAWFSLPSRESDPITRMRSEEHTSELQSRFDLVCRLLLEKKKDKQPQTKRPKIDDQ